MRCVPRGALYLCAEAPPVTTHSDRRPDVAASPSRLTLRVPGEKWNRVAKLGPAGTRTADSARANFGAKGSGAPTLPHPSPALPRGEVTVWVGCPGQGRASCVIDYITCVHLRYVLRSPRPFFCPSSCVPCGGPSAVAGNDWSQWKATTTKI